MDSKRLRISLLFAIAAALVVITAGIPSFGISTDSGYYLSAAEHVVDGDGFYAIGKHDTANGPLVLWPPLYPALLAALHAATGAPLNHLAGAVNLAGALLVLYSFGRWFRNGGALLAALLVIGSPAFLEIYNMAWTEMLFVGFVALFLSHAGDYWREPNRASLRWMMVAAVLATMTRYTGVTVIAGGFLVIAARKRYREAILFGALASLPLALWLARNYALTGTLAGSRPPSPYTLVDNLTATGVMLTAMLAPPILVVIALWHRIRRAPFPQHTAPALAFAGIYLAFLVASSTLMKYDPINYRLLSPVLIPVAGITAGLFARIRHHDTVISTTLE